MAAKSTPHWGHGPGMCAPAGEARSKGDPTLRTVPNGYNVHPLCLAEAAKGLAAGRGHIVELYESSDYGKGKLRPRFSHAKNRMAPNEIIVATIGTIIGVQILDETQRKDRTVGNVAPV